jgi:hypothetical protein
LVPFWGYPHPGLEGLCRGQFFGIGYGAPRGVISACLAMRATVYFGLWSENSRVMIRGMRGLMTSL